MTAGLTASSYTGTEELVCPGRCRGRLRRQIQTGCFGAPFSFEQTGERGYSMEEVVEKQSRVLTYPRKLLGTAGSSGHMAWYPVGPDVKRVEELWSWKERPAAERSMHLVQPIPCAVIVDGAGRCCVLQHTAKDSGLGGLSLMVGGHVDEEDARDSLEATLMACLVRELSEEVDLPEEPAPRLPGSGGGRALNSVVTARGLHLREGRREDRAEDVREGSGGVRPVRAVAHRRVRYRERGWTGTSSGLTRGRPSSSG